MAIKKKRSAPQWDMTSLEIATSTLKNLKDAKEQYVTHLRAAQPQFKFMIDNTLYQLQHIRKALRILELERPKAFKRKQK